MRDKLVCVVARAWLTSRKQYKDLPTLGFTHFQPAQPTTVGKRAALWMQRPAYGSCRSWNIVASAMLPLRRPRARRARRPALWSCLTATIEKVKRLGQRSSPEKWALTAVFRVSGQTYSRKTRQPRRQSAGGIAQSAYQICQRHSSARSTSRRLRSPLKRHQIGSSAMAYKRNPMRSERIASLARYVMVDALEPRRHSGDPVVRAHAGRLGQQAHCCGRGLSGVRRRFEPVS